MDYQVLQAQSVFLQAQSVFLQAANSVTASALCVGGSTTIPKTVQAILEASQAMSS